MVRWARAVGVGLTLGLAACAMEGDPETTMRELRVLALTSVPAEPAPGETVILGVEVVDPLGEGADLAVWACTPVDGRCLEAGPPDQPVGAFSFVARGVEARASGALTVPAALAFAIEEAPVDELPIALWALACVPGRCPVIDDLDAAPEAGSPAWAALIDTLSDPFGLAGGLPIAGTSLASRRLIVSNREAEERNAGPMIVPATEAVPQVEAEGSTLLRVELSGATLVVPTTTRGAFEFAAYDAEGEDTLDLRWFGGDEPGEADIVVVAQDEAGAQAVWRVRGEVE